MSFLFDSTFNSADLLGFLLIAVLGVAAIRLVRGVAAPPELPPSAEEDFDAIDFRWPRERIAAGRTEPYDREAL